MPARPAKPAIAITPSRPETPPLAIGARYRRCNFLQDAPARASQTDASPFGSEHCLVFSRLSLPAHALPWPAQAAMARRR